MLFRSTQMTFEHFGMHILCSKMLRQLHVSLGADIFNWLEEYRDDRNLVGIVLALFLDAAKGSPVILEACELMAGFVARNDNIAQRDTRAIYAVVDSRKTGVSDDVVAHDDGTPLLVS